MIHAMDAFMAGVEPGPSDVMPVLGVVLRVQGSAPSLPELRALLEPRVRALPSLCCRLTGTRWEPSPIDLEAHVLAHALAPGAEPREVAARELLGLPLPAAEPRWQMWLLSGHDPQEYALFYRTHHAQQDVGGIVATLEGLFARVAGSASSALVAGLAETPVPADAVEQLALQLRGGAPAAEVEPWVAHAPSLARWRGWASLATAELRYAGGTCNDGYLAALGCGIGHWIAEHVDPAQGVRVPALVPLNVRLPNERHAPGNRIVMSHVTLPGRAAASGHVLDVTAGLKSRSARLVLRRALETLPLTEALAVLRELAVRTPGVLMSSFVLRQELRVGSARVERVEPIMFSLRGSPLTALLLSYQGVSTVSFVADAALPGVETLPARWLDAVAAL